MVSKRTRPSRNKQTMESPVNASEIETEPDIEATGEAGAQSPTGRSLPTKVKASKKKTSPIWKHFDEVLVEETIDDVAVMKNMAECNYCGEVIYAPSKQDDWENAAILCKCLEIFYEATKLLSGSYYPTANLFFSEFCEINLKLIEWNKSKNKFIVSMAKSMTEKFDKYWGVSNVALAVACFLDPRYKMKVVEFYYSEMSDDYGYNDMYEFKKIVQKLYDSYASKYASPETSPRQRTEPRTARTSQCYVDLNEEPKRKRLSMFLRDNAEEDREVSDYEKYCNEPLLSWKEGDYFDILSWWKTHAVRYPILAQMARDVLAIPATTVASESAFSLGGRIVHKYRSRLDPQVVEALVCSKDWIRASREDQSGVSSILDDLAGLSVNDDKVEHDEGAPIDDDYNMMDLEEEDN